MLAWLRHLKPSTFTTFSRLASSSVHLIPAPGNFIETVFLTTASSVDYSIQQPKRAHVRCWDEHERKNFTIHTLAWLRLLKPSTFAAFGRPASSSHFISSQQLAISMKRSLQFQKCPPRLHSSARGISCWVLGRRQPSFYRLARL